ncbi:MAG: nucleoside triphosphate pyrophosphohydrolase [Methylovirgula sp.]
MQKSRNIDRLLEIMTALRDPRTGCPWDVAQTFATIAPYTIEEAYEVANAIGRNDLADLKDELGDLLLQVVFHARMAQEQNAFDFGDVVEAIAAKMIRRHPHVFGAKRDLSRDEVAGLWAKIKAEEKAAQPQEELGLLADVPLALPGLTRAVKLQSKASTVGFDWNDPRLVLDKIREETREIEAALDAKDDVAIQDEIGDLLFAVANLARHVGADPEASIRGTNAKFERRFGHIETEIGRRGQTLGEVGLAEMDALWNDAKAREK